MKPVIAAVTILLASFPAFAQGNIHAAPAAPPSGPTALAQQALDACPVLIARTESAVADGHSQYYYSSDCECMARSIDSNTWNESSADFDGPPMPDSDARTIANALANGATIEDAFDNIDSNISVVGYSAASACFGK